ncbi:MAG: YgcG family protein [Candidatus Pristimantibacillus sp.]
MKRLFRMIVVVIILFGATPLVYSAAIPEKTEGFVQDLAGMFADSASEELEQAAQEGKYIFHVLTIDSLDGEDPAVFATKVYKGWQLQSDDVLLVISKSERRIELNFNNSSLQDAIDQLPSDYDGNGNSESKLTELINEHFIPLAKEGDFAGASLSLMQATDSLQVTKPTITAAPNSEETGTGAAPIVTKQPNSSASRPTSEPIRQTSPQSDTRVNDNTILLWLLGLLLAAGIIVLGIMAWLKKRKVNKQQNRIAELMVDVEHANGELKPFVGLVQGTTEQLVAAVDQSLSELLVSLNQLRIKADGEKVFPFNFSKLNAIYTSLYSVLNDAEAKIASLRGDIERIVAADKSVRKTTDDLHIRLPALRAQTDEQKSRTTFPFTAIYSELTRLDAKLIEADKLEVFDPIEADKTAGEAWKDSDTLETHVNAISGYLDKYRSFPAVSTDCRAEIERITEENGIRRAIMRLNPYALVDQAHEVMERLYGKLQEGNMAEVIQLGAEADQLLAEAIRGSNRQAELKKQNEKDMDYLEMKQALYGTDIRIIDEQFGYIRTNYAQHHWLALQERFDRMKMDVKDAALQLPELKQLGGADRQEYDRVRELLDGWLTRYHEADSIVADCTRIFRELDERLAKAKQYNSKLWSQFESIQSLVRREALPSNAAWQQSYAVINEAYRTLSGWLLAAPYHLDNIESELGQYEKEVNGLQSQVNRKVEEKREAERRMREAQAMYDTVYRRTGSKINRSAYNSSFGSLSKQAEQMIAAGMYAQAISEMAGLNQIVDQMNREHQAAEAEERREEMMRNNSSGGSSWGSGGSSGDGHSSGGGSFGGGGGSDSNSGGGGGNSSGGSNW